MSALRLTKCRGVITVTDMDTDTNMLIGQRRVGRTSEMSFGRLINLGSGPHMAISSLPSRLKDKVQTATLTTAAIPLELIKKVARVLARLVD